MEIEKLIVIGTGMGGIQIVNWIKIQLDLVTESVDCVGMMKCLGELKKSVNWMVKLGVGEFCVASV